MSRPLDCLDELEAGEALREAADAIFTEFAKNPTSQDSWSDCIGDDRDVFARFARELERAGYVIARQR